MRQKQRVLFLCTGNSYRSQMAEGLVNHFLADQWEAFSAGTEPAGYVHPLAVQVMSEQEINISDHYSKTVEEFREVEFDQVITVCDDAAENCPVWLGSGRVTHISFPDPAKATGSEAERLAAFRQVRDNIGQRVLNHLAQNSNSKSGQR
jgi:arsenate reductase